MQKTANWGVIYPQFWLRVTSILNPIPPGYPSVCNVIGSNQITTSIQKFTLNCTVPSQFVLTAPNAFRLDVGYYIATSPGNHNLFLQTRVEGAAGGNYDSTVVIPQPQSLSTPYWSKDYIQDVNNVVFATATPQPVDQTPPTAPTNLTHSGLTSSSATLSWAASTDSGTGVAGYKIYRQRGSGPSLPIASPAWGAPFTDDTLQSQTTYTYRIVAFDNALNDSAPSNSVTFTTP
jgi:hypothetical protein